MDTPMKDATSASQTAGTSPEARSTPGGSSEASPQPVTAAATKPVRSTALATAARKAKKRKLPPDGRSKAVVCDQCRTRKTSCDLQDPCGACKRYSAIKAITCSYERTDPVAREEKLQELEAKRVAREAALTELQQAAPPGHYDMNTRSGGRTRTPRSSNVDYSGDMYDPDEAYMAAMAERPTGAEAPTGQSSSGPYSGAHDATANGAQGPSPRKPAHTHDPDSGFASSATSSAAAAARSKARPALYRPGDENALSRRNNASFGSAIRGGDARPAPPNDSLRLWMASRNEPGGTARFSGPPPLPPIDLSGRVRDSILYHFPTAAPLVRDGPWQPGQPLPEASDAFEASDPAPAQAQPIAA